MGRVRVGIPGEAFVGPPGRDGEPGPPGRDFEFDRVGPLSDRPQYDGDPDVQTYLDDEGFYYVKDETGAWSEGREFRGPQGERGEVGPEGEAGPQGIQGEIGPQGQTGATGAAGSTGAKGDTGAAGPQGIQGEPGADGTNGTDGEDGLGVPPGGAQGQVLTKNSGVNNDTSWLDSPPPGPHADNHSTAGADPISPEDIGAQPAGNYVLGDDARLSDTRDPKPHETMHDDRYQRVDLLDTPGNPSTLDEITGKHRLDDMPDELLGKMDRQGLWNAATNTPDLGAMEKREGWYWIVSVEGATNYGGKTDWKPKDWIVWNGVDFEWVDNTDSVSSVFGRAGNVGAQNGDYTAEQVSFTAAGGIIATNVQAALQELDSEKQAKTEKDQANGYAGLNASGRVDTVRLGSGTRDATTVLFGDGQFKTAPSGGGAVEAVRLVGASGQPSFSSGWSNLGSVYQQAGFWKDPFGMVYLRGSLLPGSTGANATVFTLPTGYRPPADVRFSPQTNGTSPSIVLVQSDGKVVPFLSGNNVLALDGIFFRV